MELPHLIVAAVNTGDLTQAGIGLGSVLGVVCSWERNRSILWALIAGLLSWVYVIYFVLTREAWERGPRPRPPRRLGERQD